MARYAQTTTVPIDRTKAEIESVLRKYGADQFASGWDASRALVGFRCRGRQIRFILTLPDRKSRDFTQTPKHGWARSPEEAEKAWEQACRQCWRALLLCIKAKLESVEAGIETFDEAFMPHIILPGGESVSDWLAPQIEAAYETGQMPKLLPFLGDRQTG